MMYPDCQVSQVGNQWLNSVRVPTKRRRTEEERKEEDRKKVEEEEDG